MDFSKLHHQFSKYAFNTQITITIYDISYGLHWFRRVVFFKTLLKSLGNFLDFERQEFGIVLHMSIKKQWSIRSIFPFLYSVVITYPLLPGEGQWIYIVYLSVKSLFSCTSTSHKAGTLRRYIRV